MPVRKTTATKQKTYRYEDLLIYLREWIDGNYKSVSEFLRSEKFEELGFDNSSSTRARVLSLLSLPPEGEEKVTKSIPVMQKIFKGLFDLDIESRTVVIKTQIISLDKALP